MKNLKFSLVVAATLLLVGCAFSIFDRVPRAYSVKKGDTLYSISAQYNLDYKQVAKLNGIPPPYDIYVGQRLKLGSGDWSGEQDGAPKTGRSLQLHQTKTQREVAEKMTKLPAGQPRFRWPVEGKVLRGFSEKAPVNKGIDIASKAGEPVRAAADGVVVYVGGSLQGYGKLVILKHSNNFLSAYANNTSTSVKEGNLVRSGKPLGKVGINAKGEAMLHFEIRRNGKPVNPLTWLPSGF